MATEIKMPQLGESVVEGTISRWLKQPGDQVAQYEALLEVTTDKVDTEVPAPVAGTLREIVVAAGTTVRIGTLLCILDDLGAALRPASTDGAGPAVAQPDQSTFMSPVVARMVAEHGLDIRTIHGTGAGGRVSKKDVLRYLEETTVAGDQRVPGADQRVPGADQRVPGADQRLPGADQRLPGADQRLPGQSSDELVPLSPMRRSIAEHMTRSVRTAPHVTTIVEVDVGRVATHRERTKASFERQGVRLTFTPYFVQALAALLPANPIANASFSDDGIILHRQINIGVAVALDDGLIVPVVRDADEKNLLGLARAVNDLAERARTRRLRPEETQGGTFTLTNHGVSGSLLATPIINQPQAAILGVGAIEKRVVVLSRDGVDALAIRPMCYLSLTFDHRMLDGASADTFLVGVKSFIEHYAD